MARSIQALILTLSLGLSSVAFAQSSGAPLFGGCTTSRNLGSVCVGADISIALLTINLAESNLSFGTRGGPGVLVRAWSDKWYSAGVGGYLVTNVGGSAPNEIDPSIVLNFAQYVRVGMGWILREQGSGQPFLKQACLLIGVGIQ